MLAASPSPRNVAGSAERRARARTPVAPPIYVNVNNLNGGLVFNISEDGLALTAATSLASDATVTMRILLPDSKGWVEASGKIAWTGESEKEAGVRFVNLAEETRERIRSWIAAEIAQGAPQPEQEILPRVDEEPAGEEPPRTVSLTLPNPVDFNMVAEECEPEPVLTQDSAVETAQEAEEIAEPVAPALHVAPDDLVDAANFLQRRSRRVHARWQIKSPNYVELGAGNGGRLLNISEGGFAVAAAASLNAVDLPSVRIQFTGSRDCLKVSGQIAWISASRREAGIRFVNLTQEAREIIVSRISREQSSRAPQGRSAELPEGRANRPERLDVPKFPGLTPDVSSSASSTQSYRQELPSARDLGFAMNHDRVLPSLAAEDALAPEFSQVVEYEPQSRISIHLPALVSGARSLRHFAAAIVLAGILAGTIGWVATRRDTRKGSIGVIVQEKANTNKPTDPRQAPSTNPTGETPALRSEEDSSMLAQESKPVLASGPATDSEARVAAALAIVRNFQQAAPERTVKSAVRSPEKLWLNNQTAKLPKPVLSAVSNPAPGSNSSQVQVPPSAQLAANTAPAVPSLPTSAPSATGLLGAREREVPAPPVEPPAAPVVAGWSVAVSTDPYPSIRMPRKMSSPKSSDEKSLQIGRILSRVEPVYPEEAKRQGIEGTVKLHIVAGRDGAVQKVEPISGPDLLAKAAVSAIREWRYAQTLLGGKPMETEQDVVVNFRKINPANSKK